MLMAGLLTKWQAQGYQHNTTPSVPLSVTYVQLQAPVIPMKLKTELNFKNLSCFWQYKTETVQLGFGIPHQLAHLENGKSSNTISEQHVESFLSLWSGECIFSVLFIKYVAQKGPLNPEQSLSTPIWIITNRTERQVS